MVIVALFLLGAAGLLYYSRLGNLANPPVAFAATFAAGLIAVEWDGWLLDPVLSLDAGRLAGVFILALGGFLIPWLGQIKRREFEPATVPRTVLDHPEISSLLTAVEVGLSAAILLGCVLLRQVPLIWMLLGRITVEDLETKLLPSLPFGLMAVILTLTVFHALLLASLVARSKVYRISRERLLYSVPLALTASLWQGKRQMALFYLFILFARRDQGDGTVRFSSRAMRWITIGIVGFVFVLAFSKVRQIRVDAQATDTHELADYEATAQLNLIAILRSFEDWHTMRPNAILSQMIPDRFLQSDIQEQVNQVVYNTTSPSGYLAPWFLDFGYAGIPLGTLLMGLAALIAYERRRRSEAHMRLYLLVVWCCAAASVYEHFISLTFFVLPMLFMWFLGKALGLEKYGEEPRAFEWDGAKPAAAVTWRNLSAR